MQTADNIEKNLRAIREVLDINTEGIDVSQLVEIGKKLASLVGLSAECMAASQRRLQAARLTAIKKLVEQNYSPSIVLKMAEAECGLEVALHEYADRLNAGISHQLDFFRSVVSLHKVELENSLK